jgi:hypothetical protein
MTLDVIRNGIRTARTARAVTRDQIERVSAQLKNTAAGPEADVLQAKMAALRGDFAKSRVKEAAQFAINLDPREQFFQANGSVPVLLFPLRIQSRFDGNSLLVRVYPDEVSTQSHDPRLTDDERAAGRLFWAAPEAADTPDVQTRRDIWRGNAARFGLRRAAWIMQAANPQNPPPPADELNQTLRVPAAWTLPERLVFRFYGPHDLLLREIIGEPIPDGLEMAFDPARPDLGFGRKDGDITFGPEVLWQTDVATAISVGMAISVPLDALGNTRRVEKLIVMGVRLANDEKESAVLLEQLINDHRYTDGFAILPQGTPTNVTEDSEPPSAPDPDLTLDWLRGPGAYQDGGKATLYQDECDSLRLAHALGISPEATRYLDNAQQKDAAEAIAMKRALWAGTLGYFAQQMLAPGMDQPPFLAAIIHNGDLLVETARFYFTHFVFGRGPLPALRVGDQPYGILPVSSSMLKAEPENSAVWPDSFLNTFMEQASGKMLMLLPAWLNAVPSLSQAGAGGRADARLLDVLAQQASSVEYHAEHLIGQEYLQDYADFKDPVKGKAEFAKLITALNQFQKMFPALFATRPNIFNLSFFGGSWASTLAESSALNRSLSPLLFGDVIDHLPFSEATPIADSYPNYIASMRDGDFAAVRRGFAQVQADGKTVPLTSLLYIVLRHSYLHEYAYAATRLYHHFQNVPWTAFREKEVYNAGFALDRTYWDYLEHAESWSLGGPAPVQSTALSLLENRKALRQSIPRWKDHFGDVEDLHNALDVLAPLPTARLERLFAEHIDLASYRLDAWITGHVYQRLLAARIVPGQNAAVPMFDGIRYDLNAAPMPRYEPGIYLGAYGWVEGIQADAPPAVVPDLPAEMTPVNGKPTTRDPDNYGFIHGPSLNHAVTAALLRNASVTEPDTTAFNIDLSSSRVREALWMIEGVRNGQAPAGLLGYKFERNLRDLDVKLQQYLPQLRSAFPMPRQPDTDPGPDETVPARDVVNGLRLIQAQRDGTLATALAFVEQNNDLPALLKLGAALTDTLDACSDLMLAESVHQAAQGNYERAGGVVTAAGEFTHVPDEFQVVETPRSGAALTHRVLIAMNPDEAVAAGGASARSALEPQLNTFAGTALGSINQLSCAIIYTFTNENGLQAAAFAITLDLLGLEPIDLLFALDSRVSNEFANRVDSITRPQFEAAHGAVTITTRQIDYQAQGAAGTQPLGNLIPLLDRLRMLLVSARPATQRDFLPPNMLHGQKPDAVDAIDTAELLMRVLGVSAVAPGAVDEGSLWGRFVKVAASFDALEGLAADALQTLLMSAAQFGIPEAVPVPGADLIAQAARIRIVIAERQQGVLAKWVAPAMPTVNVLQLCRDVTNIVLGANFPLMPRIHLTNDLAQAALPAAAPARERIEDWLFLTSTIREHASRLQHVRILGEATSLPLPDLQIFQWPASQKTWVADSQPADQKFVGDLISVVVQPVNTFDPTRTITALHLDEWHEVIPSDTETTGISFNYNAPHSEPPQSLLLAVSQRKPNNNLRWTWEELVSCVEQSLTLSKIRAVGPDELRKTPLDALLPATLAAEASTPATISTSYFINISDHLASTQHEIWKKT